MSFTLTLEHKDGSPAEPPTLSSAVPNWNPGDTIPLGVGRALRVVDIQPSSEPNADPVLVVEAA
jgi:hypothetical protein